MTPADISKLVKARIDIIAPTISAQPLGLAYHRPEDWADAARCLENVARKVSQHGGRTQFGWTFHLRFLQDAPDLGYLFITHHAVWHAPDGRLVNMTPYPEPKHHPLPRPGSDILFLVDDKALPVQTDQLIAPLPLRFFALTDDERLAAHVKRLNDEEQEKCGRIYAGRGS